MKKEFKNYLLDEKKIIENGIIILDTNILLNLYKVTFESRDKVLEIIKKAQDRIYMPYWIGKEFMDVRRYVINELILSMKNCIEDINTSLMIPKFKENLIFYDSTLQKEVSEYLENEIKNFKKIIKCELTKKIKEKNCYIEENSLNDDPFLKNLLNLYNKKTGKKIDEEKLNEIMKKGNERYIKKLPPGYKDNWKENDIKKYGDFIIWEEILDYGKNEKRNIIFVTDDVKEDWYEQLPTTLDPQKKEKRAGKGHQFLVDEFMEKTGKDILIITSKDFINKIGDFYKITEYSKAEKELETLNETQNYKKGGFGSIPHILEVCAEDYDKYKIEILEKHPLSNGMKRGILTSQISFLYDKIDNLGPYDFEKREELVEKINVLNQIIDKIDSLDIASDIQNKKRYRIVFRRKRSDKLEVRIIFSSNQDMAIEVLKTLFQEEIIVLSISIV